MSVQQKLALSFTAAFLALAVMVCLMLFGVLHWSLWLPGIIGAVGVIGSNAIQIHQVVHR